MSEIRCVLYLWFWTTCPFRIHKHNNRFCCLANIISRLYLLHIFFFVWNELCKTLQTSPADCKAWFQKKSENPKWNNSLSLKLCDGACLAFSRWVSSFASSQLLNLCISLHTNHSFVEISSPTKRKDKFEKKKNKRERFYFLFISFFFHFYRAKEKLFMAI
jgi:hypothetical protein